MRLGRPLVKLVDQQWLRVLRLVRRCSVVVGRLWRLELRLWKQQRLEARVNLRWLVRLARLQVLL